MGDMGTMSNNVGSVTLVWKGNMVNNEVCYVCSFSAYVTPGFIKLPRCL